MATLEMLKENLRKVINGELDASELDLKDTPVDIERLPSVSLRSLNAEHYRYSLIAAAANQIGFGTLEKTANACLSYLAILASKFHNANLLPIVVDAQGSAETILSLIDELDSTMLLQSLNNSQQNSHEIVQAGDDNAEDSGQVEGVKAKEVNREDVASTHTGNNGKMLQERGECSKDNGESNKKKGEDPTEQEHVDVIEAPDDNAKDSGEVESVEVIEVNCKDAAPIHHSNNGKTSQERGESSKDNGKSNKTKGKDIIERGESSTTKGESDKKKGKCSKLKLKEGDQKHYVSRKCPLCKKSVCTLKRHLIAVHVRKYECLP